MKVLLHKPSHTKAEREDNINKNRNLDVLPGQRSLLTVCLGVGCVCYRLAASSEVIADSLFGVGCVCYRLAVSADSLFGVGCVCYRLAASSEVIADGLFGVGCVCYRLATSSEVIADSLFWVGCVCYRLARGFVKSNHSDVMLWYMGGFVHAEVLGAGDRTCTVGCLAA